MRIGYFLKQNGAVNKHGTRTKKTVKTVTAGKKRKEERKLEIGSVGNQK